MLPREQRITKAREFSAVVQQGRMWTDGPLALRALSRGSGKPRFGLVVSKRVGNAVTRNRVKRRLREILRGLPVNQGWDVMLSARPEAATADYRTLRGVVIGLLQRGGLLAPEVSGTTHDVR